MTLNDATDLPAKRRGDRRAPVTEELGLDAAGVRLDERGFVAVDDHLRTTCMATP